MATEIIAAPAGSVILHGWVPMVQMSDDDFLKFCRQNKDYRFEINGEGDLIVMSPTVGETGRRNFQLAVQLGNWVNQTNSGKAFDSSTGFLLPNGAKRSPDISWVANERWDTLSESDQERFPPLTPDFVVELRSKTDTLEPLRAKLQEYMENGARLGWLIDPYDKRIEVFRPKQPPMTLEQPATVSGDPELPGFTLEMERLWAK